MIFMEFSPLRLRHVSHGVRREHALASREGLETAP